MSGFGVGSVTGSLDRGGADVTLTVIAFGDRALTVGVRVTGLGEIAPETPAHHLGDRGDVTARGAVADLEPAVVGLAGQPVLEHDQRGDHIGALHVGDVDALDAQRRRVQTERVLDLLQRRRARGQVACPAQLVLGEGLGGVAGDGLGERALVTALRRPELDPRPPQPREPLGQRRDLGGQLRDQDLLGHRLVGVVRGLRQRRLLAVELGEEPLDEVRGVGRLDLVDHPAALAANPAAAHVEDLDGGLQLVIGERDDIGVGAVAEHHGLLLHGPAQRADVVAQPGGPLELQVVGRLRHPPLQLPDEVVGAAGEEVAEVLDDLAVLRRRRPARRTGRSTCRCSRAGTGARSGRAA